MNIPIRTNSLMGAVLLPLALVCGQITVARSAPADTPASAPTLAPDSSPTRLPPLLADPEEAARVPSIESLQSTKAGRDARLGWWREARFGMFVHWGVYSGLGGTWNGKPVLGYAEHIQRLLKIPVPVYRRDVAGKFNPTEFNADEWMRLAKQAGMGYFIITAKHHDGFAMFDSKASDYNIVKATPFARDPMRELRAAATKYGIKFGFYYSHARDWGEENGPGNDWDYQNPGGDRHLQGVDWWNHDPAFLARARKYVDEKAIPQLQELIGNYDPDILWFDTPHLLPWTENLRIFAAVRKASSRVVINGRIFSQGGELAALEDYHNTGDRPAEFSPHGGDWEGVPTTNESYGYNQNDHSHKPAGHFVRLLAKAAARGGNILMNVGPMGTGQIDPADVAILEGIGAWWKVNGESIRGTTRTPLAVQSWGESTRKGNDLYLHVFDWPGDGKLVVGGLKTEVTRAALLAAPGEALAVTHDGVDLTVAVPRQAPNAVDSVIVLTCAGEPQADPVRLLSGDGAANVLRVFDGTLSGRLAFGPGKTTDDWVSNWTSTDDTVVWPVRLKEKTTFEVSINYDAPKETTRGKIDGDTGKESTAGTRGAGGTYTVSVGQETFAGTVRQGTQVAETLGKVTLEAGSYNIRIATGKITGEELFRPRLLTLGPPANAK